MSLLASTLILGSAIYSYSFKIWDIRTSDAADGSCHISAKADNGPLVANVSWAPCREIDVRIMSADDLEKSGQLKDLGWLRDSLLEEPKQLIITAWGSHAAAAYARGHKSRATTVEIPLAD